MGAVPLIVGWKIGAVGALVLLHVEGGLLFELGHMLYAPDAEVLRAAVTVNKLQFATPGAVQLIVSGQIGENMAHVPQHVVLDLKFEPAKLLCRQFAMEQLALEEMQISLTVRPIAHAALALPSNLRVAVRETQATKAQKVLLSCIVGRNKVLLQVCYFVSYRSTHLQCHNFLFHVIMLKVIVKFINVLKHQCRYNNFGFVRNQIINVKVNLV